jgi:hypothetical protein
MNITPLAQRVRTHLHTHHTITAMDAMRAFGLSSGSLTRRLTELKQAGERVTHSSKIDPLTSRKYGVWSLQKAA